MRTYVVYIAAGKSFSSLRIDIIKHFIEQYDLLLKLVQFRERLSTIIRFLLGLCTGELFH